MSELVEKYAESLLNGMRKDGLSIVECCLIWGITDKEYMDLLNDNIKLQYAHQIGEMHCAAWWHMKYRDLAEKGNASALTFGMKNIDKVGWQDKPFVEEKVAEPVRALEIRILPPRAGEDGN